MIPATDLKALTRMVMGAMKRGRPINLFWSPKDYRQHIEQNRLLYTPLEQGLALWLDRGDHYRLYFSMDGTEPLPPTNKPTITELVFMGAEGIPPCLCAWELLFRRVRLSRPPQEITAKPSLARPAEPAHHAAIYQLLIDCFDPLTGCLPSEEELMQVIRQGRALCCFEKDAPIAVLLFEADGKKAEIRHLATLKAARGKGYGTQLLLKFLNLHAELPCTVWVRKGNEPALNLYQKFGFSADGKHSVVLKRKDPLL